MKIIAGTHRGRKITLPGKIKFKPTMGVVRESIFNMISSVIEPQLYTEFLDLFCGSGIMGIEAASRWGMKVTAVDIDRYTISLLRENLDALGLADDFTIFCADVNKIISRLTKEKYNIVFLDPPYGFTGTHKVINSLINHGYLATNNLIIAEMKKGLGSDFSDFPIYKQRIFGDTEVIIFKV